MLFIRNNNEKFSSLLKKLKKNAYENINKKDKKGRTILHYAVREAGPKTVRLLIKKGADVNSADVGGYVPMHLAVIGKQLQNAKELINSGADVNVVERSGKCTPLHFACMVGEVEMVKELIKAGAKTDRPDKSSKTPADYAKNNKEIMEVLEGIEIANRQGEFLEQLMVVSENTVASVIIAKGEFLEKLEVVSENTVASVITAKEELETVDK